MNTNYTPHVDGFDGLDGLDGSNEGPVTILDKYRDHFEKYILTASDEDYEVIALWALHTFLMEINISTPRLLITSPVPGSGKTTLLDHLNRLTANPLQAANATNAALSRAVDASMRTVLLDEADRTLDPKSPGTKELIQTINSGYKRGGHRLIASERKGNGEEPEPLELSTYGPVAMAGNNPLLPEDTLTRIIPITMLPDLDGVTAETYWDDELEQETAKLKAEAERWAAGVLQKKPSPPKVPAEVKNRFKEVWMPLKRVAAAANSPSWCQRVDELALKHIEEVKRDQEEGMRHMPPHRLLMKHVYELLPENQPFIPTGKLISELISAEPDTWGEGNRIGSKLTPQRLGRMLGQYKIRPGKLNDTRGYFRQDFLRAWKAEGLIRKPSKPSEPSKPSSTAEDEALFEIE